MNAPKLLHSMPAHVVLLGVLGAAAGHGIAGGAPGPGLALAGPEIWLDGPDALRPGDGSSSDVAVDPAGRRIHVWTAFDVLDRDDIYLRRFDAAGIPLEDPRRINSTIASDQRHPRVAVAADGSFVVVYQSSEIPVGQGFAQFVTRSQAFDADGDPVGVEQLVSTLPTQQLVHSYADIAALRTVDGSPGGYFVAWRSAISSGGASNGSVEGSLLDVAGVPGAQFQVHSNDAGFEYWSSVSELRDGGFLAVWIDIITQSIQGRRFSSTGVAIGPDFQINTSASVPEVTDVGIGWNGALLVVWEDSGVEAPPLPPGSLSEIRGRWFDADLAPMGDDFRINTVTDAIQDDPRVADLGPFGFLVAWNSDVASGPDTTQSIEARVVSGPGAFDADGDGLDDPQAQYNLWDNDSTQWLPSAHGLYGWTATGWSSLTWDGDPPPADPNALFRIGRDLDACIFCADFEWFEPATGASLWRWSGTVGVAP